MKVFYKTLLLGVFLATVAMVSPITAQDVCSDFEANQTLYAKYTDNYNGTLAQKEIAVVAGNEYIKKYAACKDFDAQVNYLKKAVPKKEAEVAEQKKRDEIIARYKRFDAAVRADKADEIFASGKDILKHEPDKLDVSIVLAMTGLDEVAENKINTFNNDAISYAKSVISKLPAAPESEKHGLHQYAYNSKEDALGWMNYAIGYIMYYGQKDKDAALPYFYEATQHNSQATKDRYFIYALFGDFYRDKAIKIGNDIVATIERNKKDRPNENPETYETKMMYALQKGYAERTIDAYARAYEMGQSAKPAAKQEYLDSLKGALETFYKFRFVTEENPSSDINADLMNYVSSVSKRPLPSPTSEVQPVDPPVKDEETSGAANTTTTSSTAVPNKPAVKATDAAPTNGDKAKSEADKTGTKPKQRR